MPLCHKLYYFQHQEYIRPGSLPLILLHGAGGTHLSWPSELRRLPQRLVLAPDLPGHGKSAEMGGLQSIEAYADEVRACLNSLSLSRAILVGHSMGGAVALTLAARTPELVGGLVLISSAARFTVNSTLLQNASAAVSFQKAVEDICHWSFSSQTPERLVVLTRQRMTELRPSVLAADLQACNTFDLNGALQSIHCPTLVLCGSDDRMTPLRQSQYLADTIPGATLQIVPGAGHMLMLEQPQIVSEAVQTFCQKLGAYSLEKV